MDGGVGQPVRARVALARRYRGHRGFLVRGHLPCPSRDPEPYPNPLTRSSSTLGLLVLFFHHGFWCMHGRHVLGVMEALDVCGMCSLFLRPHRHQAKQAAILAGRAAQAPWCESCALPSSIRPDHIYDKCSLCINMIY